MINPVVIVELFQQRQQDSGFSDNTLRSLPTYDKSCGILAALRTTLSEE